MKLKSTIFFIFPLCFAFVASAQTIVPSVAPIVKKDTAVTAFEDDPIAAMLDSLSSLQYFEKAKKKSNAQKRIVGKYHFAADSVPQYDDKTYAARLAKLDAQSPFDLSYNDAVKQYILLYSVRKRDLVSRIMAMSKMYFPMFEEVLDKYNLPLELKYLAVVESALNPDAKSRTAARGLWQFMYTTGKMYNLNSTSYVDERSDPYKSTVAACEYFQFLYDTFGDWQLVLAAYNSGPGTVSRAIRRSGGKTNYWAIRPYLPKETQGYVPAFIAVNYVLNYTAEHNIFSDVPKKTFFQVDTVKIKQQLSFNQISSVLHIPVAEIEFLNPEYKLDVIPSSSPDGEEYSLCLPKENIGTFITNETAIYNYLKTDTTTSEEILAMQKTEPVIEIHKVKRGEHLSTIASRYKCSVRELKEWNHLRTYNIHAGERLTIYISSESAKTKENFASNKKEQRKIKKGDGNYYVIQSGDTLWGIAKAHGISVEKLKQMNNLSDNNSLKKGSKIIVAMSGN